MGDPGQGDHDTQDGEQEGRSDVRHQHDRAGHGPGRTGGEWQLAAWAPRRQAPLEGDDPLRIQYTPMKFTSAADARSPCRARASPRTIAITPRATVIQTSVIGPGVCSERCGLALSDG